MTTHTSGAADLPEALREVQIIQSWCEARCLPSPSAGDCVSLAAALTAGQAPAGVLEDAARYRMVRRGQRWSVVDGIGNDLRAEALDSAIDAARAQQKAGE